MGIPFSAGIQMLYDAQQRFTRAGLQVFLRVANFQDVGDSYEVGIPWAPTGTAAADIGYTDYLIDPPPQVEEPKQRNVSPAVFERLNFGSRIFTISNTFVQKQLALEPLVEAGVTDPYAVFRDRDGNGKCIGIFYDSRMFAIESVTHDEVAGGTIEWKIVGNALEVQVVSG